MKAMILAGGMSTRLYPLTKTVPKPLVPIAGDPNTAHMLRYLRSFGIRDVAINVHYLAEQIEAALGDGSAYDVRLTYLHEPKLMGSAGAVAQMKAYLGDDTFVVVGCDELTDIDLNHVLAFHRARGARATIALVEADDVSQYGVVLLGDDGRIERFQEKPARGEELSHLVNTGIYVFEPEIFAHIPAGVFVDFGKDVFPALQSAHASFYGFRAPGAYWCDIGTLGEYRRASTDVLSGRASVVDAVRARAISGEAVVAASATIAGDVHVGPGARVGARVRIVGPSVIGRDVRIEDGAILERTIVWDRTCIGAGAMLVDAIVGTDCTIPGGAILRDVVVANEPELARP